jgi:hypothetical protein
MEVPAAALMQRRRKQLLRSRDLLPREYGVALWHEALRHQCTQALAQPTYSTATVRPLLRGFLDARRRALLNAAATLHLRRAVLRQVPPSLEAVLAQVLQEHERVALLQQRVSSGDEAWESVRLACRAHLQWLIHRHRVHHRLSVFMTRLDWTLLARRADLVEAAVAGAAGPQEAGEGAHDSIEFQSPVCRWAGYSYLAVQPASTSNAEVDRCELGLLKKELEPLFGHVTDINADDGYLFQVGRDGCLFQVGRDGCLFQVGRDGCLF